MSQKINVEISCPVCGKEFETGVYRNLTTPLAPGLRKRLFDNSLFFATCPDCGNVGLVENPLVYFDKERNFLISLNDYPHLLDFKEEISTGLQIEKALKINGDTKIVGVTNISDLITTIVAFENNLDWRIVQLAFLQVEYGYIKHCLDHKKKLDSPISIGLTGEKDEKGDLILRIDVGENSGTETFLTTFPMEVYEGSLKYYKERLDLINPFVFDKNMRQHFCDFYEEDFQVQEEHKNKYYYVETSDGSIYLCLTYQFLEKKIDMGSWVLIDKMDETRDIGVVKRIVSWNSLAIYAEKEHKALIVSEYKDYHFLTTEDSNAELNQFDLVDLLVRFKEAKYDLYSPLFPLEELKQSNMFVNTKMRIDHRGLPIENADDLVELVKKDLETGKRCILGEIVKVERNGKLYLPIYTDPFYLPSNKEQTYSNAVFSFDTFVRIVKYDSRFDGIIINQFDEDIILDMDFIKKYIVLRTLNNDQEIKKLLDNLTDEEKEYMDEKHYDCLRAIYFEDASPKDLETRFGTNNKEIDKMISTGYYTLGNIIFARY